jgi:hypothetical protein
LTPLSLYPSQKPPSCTAVIRRWEAGRIVIPGSIKAISEFYTVASLAGVLSGLDISIIYSFKKKMLPFYYKI